MLNQEFLITTWSFPVETRQPPRSAYLYRKADWGGFQTYMENVKEDILASATSKSVEELWISFKSSINEDLSKFVPCKKIGSKRSLPWITQEIKRLIRKRDSLYQMYKRSSRPKYRKQFVTTRHTSKQKSNRHTIATWRIYLVSTILTKTSHPLVRQVFPSLRPRSYFLF